MSDSDAQRPNEPPENIDKLATARDRPVRKSADKPGRHGDPNHHRTSSFRPPVGESSFLPIIGERVLRRFELLYQRHRVRARIGLVLVNSRGKYYSFPPERPPTTGELLWAGPGTLYEVDMGLHWTSREFDLPSNREAFPFHAVVDVEWRVTDPVKVVRDGVDDVRETLSPFLRSTLSKVTRRFDVEDIVAAEAEAIEALTEHPIGGDYGLSTRVFLRMWMDEKIREAKRVIELAHETQALRLVREKPPTHLIEQRGERYRAMILAGDYKQFALQLAYNPDEMATVVQMVRDERDQSRRNVTDFVTSLIDSGAIDRYEVDDQVRAALDWLKAATDTVLRGPEQSARIPDQRYSSTLPSTDIPESSLPDLHGGIAVVEPSDSPSLLSSVKSGSDSVSTGTLGLSSGSLQRSPKSEKYQSSAAGEQGPGKRSLVQTILPITIYVSDESVHEQVEAAVEYVLASAGGHIEHRDDPVHGSWFREMRAKISNFVDSPLGDEVKNLAAHTVESYVVHAQDATVTATFLQNLGPVLVALQDTKEAVIRTGALLIVKMDSTLVVHQLTPTQQLQLDHQPRLAKSPHEILSALELRPDSSAQLADEVCNTFDSTTPQSINGAPAPRDSTLNSSERSTRLNIADRQVYPEASSGA